MLQVKRKKAQSISAQNKNPYILSRGGYRKLEEKIMSEKKKSRPPPSEGEDTEPPSPPSRHQKWKLARLRTSGNYTSESAREISKKIVRYNSYLNSSFMLHCRIRWLSKAPKEDSLQKVIMTHLLLQLDDLSTLDVCVVLDQESTYANFLVPSLISLHAAMVLIMKKE